MVVVVALAGVLVGVVDPGTVVVVVFTALSARTASATRFCASWMSFA